jgi:cold shock CspA family protein
MAPAVSLKGTCKTFGNTTGFGFITAEEGADVFVHITDCIDGMMPVKGDVLSYDLGPSAKKPGQKAALNVTGGSAKQTAEEKKEGGKGKGGGGGGGKGQLRDGGDMASMMHMMSMRMEKMVSGILSELIQVLKKQQQSVIVHSKATETELKPIMHSKETEIELEWQLQAIALTGKWIPLVSQNGWDKGSVIRVNTKLTGDSEDAKEVVQGMLGEVLKKDDEGDLWISFAKEGGNVKQWVNVDKQKFLDGLDCPDG